MKFTPKSEKELAEEGLLKPDNYDFEVLEASDEVSKKSGNPMIKLKLQVFGHDGRSIHIFDYLMEAMAFKLRHFCDGAGILPKYEAGEVTALDCKGRTGKVLLAIQSDKAGIYPDKNVVKDYHKASEIVGGDSASDDDQDSIPF